VADPYEVDDQGNPVAEADSAGEIDPVATEALRRQVDATLRFMALSTVVGLVIIAILAAVLSDIRGVMILVGFVYLVTSAAAYWYLRRTFNARLARGIPATAPAPPTDDPPPTS
jgi:ABC-type bacteriocin/lantibiotic exporter with double-glycine peptidase domain